MKLLLTLDGNYFEVSDCDFLFLAGYNWNRDTKGYYRCSNWDIWNGQQTHNKSLHWFVAKLMNLKIPVGWSIDHIDRNIINNQRPNLRAASPRLQNQNRIYTAGKSGYVGVEYRPNSTRPWLAKIREYGKRRYIGYFKTKEEASDAYQARKLIRDKKEIQLCQQR